MKKPIIYAFIDSQNLNLGVKSQGWNLDFAKFRILIRDKYHVDKAYLFIGQVVGNELLYANLQESGYILIFKPTLEKREGNIIKIKGNVDAELVLHAMIQYKNYDKAIIISGDGDFHCLIEYLENKNKLYKIIVPNKKYSLLLRKFRNYIVHTGDFRFKIQKERE